MYFTRFPINMSRRDARSMLASPYRLHAAIAASFPSGSEQADISDGARILWRIDEFQNGMRFLYIVSPTEPSLVGLDEQIGWPDKPSQWETKSYDSFLEKIELGQKFSFRLVANPAVSRSARGGKSDIATKNGRSKRISHLTILQQAAWLVGKDAYKGSGVEVPDLFAGQTSSRALRNGFRVLEGDVGGPHMVVSHTRKQAFRQGRDGRKITLTTAQYDGMLEVVEPDALRTALTHGIGHAKGFGCGLLTIAPLGE